MRMLICIEKEPNPIETLINRPQFRITSIREYDIVDRWIDKIKELFRPSKVYTTPSIFDIKINDQLGVLSVIPGKKIQETVWQQTKLLHDRQPCIKTKQLVRV